MIPHILIWGFIGLHVGHFVSHYVEEYQWNRYHSNLLIGLVGSLLGGLAWVQNGQSEQMLGAVLYAAIGVLALLISVHPEISAPGFVCRFDRRTRNPFLDRF